MGASRKLQGEIDRVLKKVQEGVDVFDSIWNKVYDTDNANQKEKFEADLKKEIKKLQRYRDQIKTWIQSSEIKDKKVSASYEQALLDARKQIEREMERFKVCEKETKTKAFSKEGLGLQPKTDPKEKAKSETRDWLNNAVGDLESQIENFEAEVEALSVKKGKTRPPRLLHLETSIGRHKAHIIKLELILRLLDNDELSPEQVNDVKDFVDDYVERNQDDFDEFSNVDELYSSLPLEKVDSLEEFAATSSTAFAKGVGSVSGASTAVGVKPAVSTSTQGLLGSVALQCISTQDQVEETDSQESNADSGVRVTSSRTGVVGALVSTSSISTGSSVTASVPAFTANIVPRSTASDSTAAVVLPSAGPVRGVLEISAAASSVSPPSSGKDDDGMVLLGRKQSPAPAEMVLGRGLGKGSIIGGVSSQVSGTSPVNLSSTGVNPAVGALGSVPAVADIGKRTNLGPDERSGTSNLAQPVVSSMNKVLLQQTSKAYDGLVSVSANSIGETSAIGGRVFPPSIVSNVQWRPQNMASFQSQTEAGQFRGRTEITPDQKEKYLQRFQQVQQHLLSTTPKQFAGPQQNTLLQQFGSQSSTGQVGLGLGGVPVPGVQQQNLVYHQASQHNVISSGSKDTEANLGKVDEPVLLNSSDDLNAEARTDSESDKNVEEDFKAPFLALTSTTAEAGLLSREMDMSPKKPVQGHLSSSIGVIGSRRSISDLGTIGDVSTSGGSSGLHDHIYNLQMLEAAYSKLPQPKDSERVKNYIPRNSASTPPSYPQVQAPVINNPLFWERLGVGNFGTDTLFFAFYYQQNTYQQYLAARELKKQSWRYHRKYNTWFQRHEEPKITTDDYEQGTYVYFDFHIAEDQLQHGWCQRIKTDFTFEYSYLEDELVV